MNATAKEDCDCTHGAYGGFSDVPSHEIRDFTLKVSHCPSGSTEHSIYRQMWKIAGCASEIGWGVLNSVSACRTIHYQMAVDRAT